MDKDEIRGEINRLMSETIPIEEPDKKNSYFPKISLLAIVGVLVLMLSLSYNPDPKLTNTSTKPSVYYTIEKPPIEINIEAASANDFPQIRIGPGCSFSRNITRHSANNIQDI